MKTGLLEKIKGNGYWRVNFQPLVATTKIKTLQECRDLVEKNSVELRGWDYPHFPRKNDENSGTAPAGDFFEGWEDWAIFKEFWRMYKSGQFLYYRGLREDWLAEDDWRPGLANKIKPGTRLAMLSSVIYELTEVFQFLSRLVQAGLYDEGVLVNLSVHNLKDRELWVDDEMRLGFHFPKKTSATELKFELNYTKEQLISDPKGLANDVILQVFDAFGWNPPKDQIIKDQDKFLSGRA